MLNFVPSKKFETMKFVVTTIVFLLTLSVSAQQLCMSTMAMENEKVDECQWQFTSAPMSAAQVDLKRNSQMTTGRNLLISGGCCAVAGAAIFPLAYLCISDAPAAHTLGGICSIGGVVLMGASVPLFIAGSVLYVKGKKHDSALTFTGNGLTITF